MRYWTLILALSFALSGQATLTKADSIQVVPKTGKPKAKAGKHPGDTLIPDFQFMINAPLILLPDPVVVLCTDGGYNFQAFKLVQRCVNFV